MRKFVSNIIAITLVANVLALTGCGKNDSAQSSKNSSAIEGETSITTTNSNDLANSKLSVIETLDSLVSNAEFVKKTDKEQQNDVQNVLNQYVASSIIKAGTISFDSKTRTFNFIYADGEKGFYSLSGVKYSSNNEDNLVWQGQTPVISEPDINEDDSSDGGQEIGNSNIDNSSGDGNESSVDNSKSENAYIIGVKLNYNNATGLIQGRFITSTGGAYAFDFTDRFTMMDLDLLEQLNNIIETRTCTYGIDSDTLNRLIQLSNSIDYTADLYQTVGDTQQDIISEIIYTYNRKTGLLVECCASGVKESKLNDPDVDDFVVELLDAIDNKVQRLNR